MPRNALPIGFMEEMLSKVMHEDLYVFGFAEYSLACVAGCFVVCVVAALYPSFMFIVKVCCKFLFERCASSEPMARNIDYSALHLSSPNDPLPPYAVFADMPLEGVSPSTAIHWQRFRQRQRSYYHDFSLYDRQIPVGLVESLPVAEGGSPPLPDFVRSNFGFVNEDFVPSSLTGAFGANKSKYKRSHDEPFVIYNGNVQNNRQKIARFRAKPLDAVFVAVLEGMTETRFGTFPFPVLCDKKQFLKVVVPLVEKLSKEDMRCLMSGFVTPSNRHVFERMWGPPKTVSWQTALVCAAAVFSTVSPVVFWFSCLSTVVSAFDFVMLFFKFSDERRLRMHILSAPFLEEPIKVFVGAFPFVIVETLLKASLFGFQWYLVLPALMHLSIQFIPNIWLRVVAHLAWNIIVPALFAGATAVSEFNRMANFIENLEMVEDGSKIIDVMRKLFARDLIGVALSVTSNARWFIQICHILGNFDGVLDILEFVPSFFRDPNAPVMLEPEVHSSSVQFFLDKTRRIFPKWISHSPTYAKISSFVLLLCTSSFLSSSYAFNKFCSYFDFADLALLSELSEPIEIVMSLMKAVFVGCRNVYEKGSWKAFFDMPKDIYFLSEVAQLTFCQDKSESEEDIMKFVAHAQRLISERTYSVNTVEISRKLDLLRQLILDKQNKLSSLCSRVPPMVFFMAGEAGTGKTTLAENVVEFHTVIRGNQRFVGDTLNYNIYDKYPISTGCNTEATVISINDIPAVYTEFPKQDLLPLDVIMQRIVDTSPLDFRSAAVGDKGKMFNKLELVIITANHLNYVCPGETDKLNRRFDGGVLVSVDVVDPRTERVLKHAEFKNFPPAKRNACWRFRVLSVVCKGKHITLTPTAVSFNFTEFMQYYKRRVEDHFARALLQKETFHNKVLSCHCGVALAMHRMPGIPSLDRKTYVRGIWGEDMWVSLTEQCDDFICERNEDLSLASYVQFCDVNRQALEDLSMLGPVLETHFLSVSAVFVLLASLSCYYLMFWLVVMILFVEQWFDFWNSERVNQIELLYLKAYEKVNLIVSFDPALEFELIAKRKFAEFKIWCRSKLKPLLVVCGLGSVGMMLRYLTKKGFVVTALASPIFSKDVDPDSMITINHRTEANFTNEERRTWNKKEDLINRVDLMTVGTSLDALEKIVRNQIQRVLMLVEGPVNKSIEVQIVLLTNDLFCLNRHYLFADDGVCYGHKITLYFKGVPFSFDVKNMLSHPDCEWVMFRHSLPYQLKDLSAYFPAETCSVGIDVARVSNEGVARAVAYPSSVVLQGRTYKTLQWQDQVKKGDCMSVLIGKFNQGVSVLGFLSYGLKPEGEIWSIGGVTLASRKIFSEMVSSLIEPLVADSSLVPLNVELTDLDPKSDLRNVSSPFIDVIATQVGSTSHFRSSFLKTRWFDIFNAKLTVPYDFPKRTSGITSTGEYSSALERTLAGFGNGDSFPVELGIKAAVSYLEDCFPQSFVDKNSIKATPLTLQEAFFGVPDFGVSKIAFNTSCGLTLREKGVKNKYDLFSKPEGSDVYKLDSYFVKKVDETLDKWRRGIMTVPVAEFVPKDEVRPKSKLDDMYVRLFSNLDATFNMPSRMYLITLLTLFLMFPRRTECYGGMNAGSKQWDEFGTWILNDGFKSLDMDFKTFDSSHGLKVFRVVAFFFFILSLRLGYSFEAAMMVYICVRSAGCQLMRYILTWFLKYGGLSSGWILTLVFNSVVNSILMRMAYMILVNPDPSGFQMVVRTGTVGDDNASGVAHSISALFNMHTIAPLYEKWGYRVTTASKNVELSAFVEKDKLQFVKRNFVYNEDLKGYAAPIAKDSIYKSLCFESKKLGVSSVQRLTDVSSNAQREAFLHGRQFFDQFQKEIIEAGEKTQVPIVVLIYENLITEYEQGSFSTFDC